MNKNSNPNFCKQKGKNSHIYQNSLSSLWAIFLPLTQNFAMLVISSSLQPLTALIWCSFIPFSPQLSKDTQRQILKFIMELSEYWHFQIQTIPCKNFAHSCFWNHTEKIVCFNETGKAYYKLIIIVIATTCRCKIQILISGYNVVTKHSWQRDNCSFGAAVFKNIQAIKFHRINKAVPICL